MNALLTLLLAAWSSAAAPSVGFDQGVDVKAVLKAAGVQPGFISPSGIPRHLHWMPGCKKLELQPGAESSGRFSLWSTEIVEECDVTPGGGWSCRRGFGRSVHRDNVRLVLRGRPASNPTETFEVCLTGPQLHVPLMITPTRYDVSVSGSDVVLTAKP